MRTAILLTMLIAVFLFSCEQPGEFTPDQEPEIFDVAVLDTFSVSTSTLMVDSIITTQVSRLLAGHISDPDLGELKASAYFKVGPGGSLDFEERNMVYDSLYLMLKFDGYAFGNENAVQRFSIREIREEYGMDETEIHYGFERLTYSRGALGYFESDPDWEAGDSIAVKLSDELGQRLFQLAEEGRVLFADEDFPRELEGLVIVPEGEEFGQVLGFSNSTNPTGLNQLNEITVRMYYHEEGEFNDQFSFDFTQTHVGVAFNGFETDRSHTALAGLSGDSPQEAAISGNKTYIQGGVGLQTKIRFPSLKEINRLDKEYIVNSAVLRIEPVKGSFSDSRQLPDSLAFYLTDKYNEVGGLIFDASASAALAQYGHLQVDDERGLYAFYEVNVTEFVFQQLQNQDNNELALLVAPTALSILGGVDQLWIGGENHADPGVTLKVYMTKLTN